MKVATDYSSWKFTQKVIRIYHNRAVVKHFKSDRDNQPTNGTDAIKASVLIRKTDSALEVMNKQLLFQGIIKKEDIFSIPESFVIKSFGADIPQLKIIYRLKEKSRTGNYDLCVPHYNGTKAINPPRYTRGEQPVIFNLRDRSKIVVNVSTESEGVSLIKYLLRFVEKKYIPLNPDNFILGAKSKIKRKLVVPIRADFYSTGEFKKIPDWRIYF